MSHTKKISQERFITPQKLSHPDRHSAKKLQIKTPPTVEPRTVYTDKGGRVSFEVEHVVSRRKNTPYLGMSQVQLEEVVHDYDHRIGILRQYLRESDLLQRKRIADIFGFTLRHEVSTKEQKVVLKQLSSRVKDLIQQNNKLKSNSKYQLEVNMEYLLKQNKKLQMILEEYKNTQDRTHDRLRAENNQLKNQIIQLNVRLQNRRENVSYKEIPKVIEKQKIVYKESPPQIIEKVVYKDSPPQVVYKEAPPQIVEKQKIVFREVPANNSEELRTIEKRLGDYITNQYLILQEQNAKNFNKIGAIENRLATSEKSIIQYKRQRQISIDSTIRKSFNLSMSLKKHIGDNDQDPEPEPQPQQERIRSSQNVTFGQPGKIVHHLQPTVPNVPTHTTTTIIQSNHSRERQLEDKLAMAQEKNKFFLIEIQNLKRFLQQSEQKGAQKVQRIIQLENELKKASAPIVVEKEKKSDENFGQEIKNIRQTLIFCNTNNFELFFNEFNEIIRQRNEMKLHLEDMKKFEEISSLQTLRKRKQNTQFLQSKVNSLTQENMKLIKKISALEEEVQNYHAELITSEIEKLQSIELSNAVPTGQKAIQWQKTVKSSIESAINKLQVLEGRMVEKKKFIKVTK